MTRYTQIDDNYDSLEQVVQALFQTGLESTRIIVGIDFTKSNERTGARSFNNNSLHHIGEITNPYEKAVQVIGETLSSLNAEENTLIFGFGDESTVDRDVFSFYSDGRSCNGIGEVLERYRELVPQVRLAGPTSFAPIIETAIDIVESSGRRYHVLFIIADGQVTRSSNTEIGQLSLQEQETIDAIVKASEYPLSIVLVGVGDGPWEMMREFGNNIPRRTFDNFQFVNLTEILSQDISLEQKHSEIALAALMKIPSQYLATLELRGLSHTHEWWGCPLPPPHDYANTASSSNSRSAVDTCEEVVQALIQAGLESTRMIIGIDFTKSNERTGARSFNNKSLHHIGEITNPYEIAITVIGETLSALNAEENNLIPCFGFGDESAVDEDVFSFYSDGRSCNGIGEVLERYRELVPHVRLAGPTSFAPIIETAIDIVESSGRRYHVLLIIADGQVTRSSNTEIGQLSLLEHETIDAIVKASEYPLSIVLVGVGDGPWEMMREFDNNIPRPTFNNFQFVNLTEILSQDISREKMHSEIALAALMEIPSQYLATLELQGLSHTHEWWRCPLPPPINHPQSPLPCPTDQQPHDDSANTASSSRSAEDTHEEVCCPICLDNPRDSVFGCGHRTCQECGSELTLCPICRTPITIRIKIYS